MSVRLAIIVLAVACGPAATAAARTSIAPPGNSGIQEYQEDLPTAGGDRPASAGTGSGGSGGGGSSTGTAATGAGALSGAQRRGLTSQGRDGALTERLVEITAGAAGAAAGAAVRDHPGASTPSTAPGSGSAGKDFAADSSSGGAVDSILGRSLGGSGGMGVALPALLLVVTLLGVVTVVRARRVPR